MTARPVPRREGSMPKMIARMPRVTGFAASLVARVFALLDLPAAGRAPPNSLAVQSERAERAMRFI